MPILWPAVLCVLVHFFMWLVLIKIKKGRYNDAHARDIRRGY